MKKSVNALNGLLSFLHTDVHLYHLRIYCMCQRPERASFISTEMPGCRQGIQ